MFQTVSLLCRDPRYIKQDTFRYWDTDDTKMHSSHWRCVDAAAGRRFYQNQWTHQWGTCVGSCFSFPVPATTKAVTSSDSGTNSPQQLGRCKSSQALTLSRTPVQVCTTEQIQCDPPATIPPQQPHMGSADRPDETVAFRIYEDLKLNANRF